MGGLIFSLVGGCWSEAWLQGPCPPTVAGPYAAWMPRKSLQGRTCGVSCAGGRARTNRDERYAQLKSSNRRA
ncbi:hypothetical protein XarbCFBP8138_08910 [Xanthomonas arboricola]|nr:hypothetical protein XarbCFBP8138_08910 [Xanthomonas arboricola]